MTGHPGSGPVFTMTPGPAGVNWRTVAVFLLGIAAEIPFMNASYPKFEGPAASAMSGADISWLVGFVVAAALYYLAVRTARSATAPEPAAAGSLPGSA